MNLIKAIIFDMDGVISDTQKLHAKVESEILGEYGVFISPEEITMKYAGVKTGEIFKELLENKNVDFNIDSMLEEKWKKMSQLGDDSIEEVDGSVDLIKKLYDSGYKLAVGSASDYNYVSNVIKSLKLEKYFDHLVSGDMVKNGKPDPEIFLLAASKLEVSPENCLVIEDGTSGMLAAKSGGMKCIGLVKDKNKKYPTDNLVFSLREINLDYLKNI
jgi:beta-phosphoglucomutase family hydrolase